MRLMKSVVLRTSVERIDCAEVFLPSCAPQLFPPKKKCVDGKSGKHSGSLCVCSLAYGDVGSGT